MANLAFKRVKLFEPLEGVYQSLGIRTSEPKVLSRFSLKCWYFLSCMGIYTTSSFAFCMFEAKTVAEHCDTFYNASTDTMLVFQIIRYAIEGPELRKLLEKFEDHFEKSK